MKLKAMKKCVAYGLGFFTIILLAGCLRPDPIEADNLVELDLLYEINTVGWARDIAIHEDLMFVAASQAGAQIWDLGGETPELVYQEDFGSDDLELIRYDARNRLLLASDRTIVHYRAMDSTNIGLDSAYYDNPSAFLDPRQLSDGNTQDFTFTSQDSQLVIYLTDRDFSDGLKRIFLTFSEESTFGGQYWSPEGHKLVNGHMRGLDMQDDLVAVTIEELGIALFQVSPSTIDTLAFADTPGEALETIFSGDRLLVANNWGGLQIFDWDGSSLESLSILDFDENVEHISIWGDAVILSCGLDECYIVDLTDPADPQVDQFIESGYCYRSTVDGDRVYMATRDGVKVYSISLN